MDVVNKLDFSIQQFEVGRLLANGGKCHHFTNELSKFSLSYKYTKSQFRNFPLELLTLFISIIILAVSITVQGKGLPLFHSSQFNAATERSYTSIWLITPSPSGPSAYLAHVEWDLLCGFGHSSLGMWHVSSPASYCSRLKKYESFKS